MHSKIIHPRQHGKFVFSNRGSSLKTVTYLGHEARERAQDTRFFNGERTGISAEELSTAIDKNAKGLRKQQEKFYSLVLSPSNDELKHLQSRRENTQEQLRTYTKSHAALRRYLYAQGG